MIDTIQFGILEAFEVSNQSKLIKKVFTQLETGETSESFFYNDEILNLNIDGKGLSVKTNLSKLYGLGDNNFYPLGANSFETAIDTLARSLDDIGIVADLDKAKIWRLDLFKNIQTLNPYGVYKDVLASLNLKRTHSQEYPEGYLMKNGLREVMFYNKVKELTERLGYAYVKQLGFSSETIIRGEERFLKAREVKTQGIEYLKEIPDKWNLLKEVYQKYMLEVFKYDYKGGETLKVETLKALIGTAMLDLIIKGRWALKYYGFYPYSFVNRDELLNALLNHFSRDRSYKILAEIEAFKNNSIKDVDYKKLYDELKEKFLNN